MGKYILIIIAILGIGAGISAFVGKSPAKKEKKITFKVYGNCEMCKKTIESSLKDVKGIKSSEWNVETKMMNVLFDEALITEKQIHQKIASVGYDTDLVKADDSAYGKLPGCCQYERKK